MILLTEKEEQLVETIRVLPAGTTDQILLWASQLADLAAGQPIDWSDAWSDEDLRDATAASVRNLEESESRERAG
jgi:fido (protein-threonine AMPylation protein)